jgi:sucrose-6F-phosphate phosphohydrolase
MQEMKTHGGKLRGNPDTLVSDLDGTLIPLPDLEQNRQDLIRLSELRETHKFKLIFATGRSFHSVLDAMEKHALPEPDWIICNVGTSIYEKSRDSFSSMSTYHERLDEICDGIEHDVIETAFKHLKKLRLQPKENQSDFKISYWCRESELHELIDQINEIKQRESLPYECLGSIDPFSKSGLIDILPAGVNKAYALDWLGELLGLEHDQIVYAGDSGNDLAALIRGYPSVLVGNATARLRAEVSNLIKDQKSAGPCYFAKSHATSGVLEGMKYFKLVDG